MAEGFLFITLEDETGISNLIVTPDLFQACPEQSRREHRLLLAGGVSTPRVKDGFPPPSSPSLFRGGDKREREQAVISRRPARAGILLAEGVFQKVDGVMAIRARHFAELTIDGALPPSHDFH